MAVNPLIALGGRIPDYDFSAQRLRNEQRAGLELERQQREQAARNEAQLIEDLKKFGSDITPETIAAAMGQNPRAAQVMEKIYGERAKEDRLRVEAKSAAAMNESKIKDAERLRQIRDAENLAKILSGVNDEASYRRAVGIAKQQGINPELVAQMEQSPYDQTEIKQFSEQYLGSKDRLDLQKAELEMRLQQQRIAELEQKIAEGVRDEQGLTAADRAKRSEPTAQQKEFGPFYEQWLKDKNLPKNAENELAARREFFSSARAAVPGVDVPLPEAVEAQKKRIAAANAAARGAASGAGVDMSQEGLEMAARAYIQTGQLPARSASLNSKIISEAARMQADANPMLNRTSYDANRKSLDQLTKQANNIEAFENTALKNLDLFLETAKKVIETGSPALNMPLRKVSNIGGGSEAQAAFGTARQVAINEIAKVLTNPGSNAVLSDSARKEVSELIREDATLGQIYAAANILKRDMQNRKQSMDEQIELVGQRIRGGYSPSGRPTGATPGAGASKKDPLGIL